MTKRVDPEGIEMQTVQNHVNLAGKDVLEIGCGDGRLAFKYANLARRVIALDPDAERIRKAKRNTSNKLSKKLEFRVGKGEELPFQEESFDIVFFTYSLCCIEIPFMIQALNEACRVLRRNGYLISVQPSLLQPFASGVVAYLLTKKFGDEEDDRFRQARFALKRTALLEGKLELLAEETCTVNYWYDTPDEYLEDLTPERKEQYSRLTLQKKQQIRKLLEQWATQEGVILRENEVFSFFTKAS